MTYSLIADYFPPHRRGFALGIFGSGVYVGLGGAMILGGMLVGALSAQGAMSFPIVGTLQPWQSALLLVGALGLPLVVLTLVLLEPRRSGNGAGLRPHKRAGGGYRSFVVHAISGIWPFQVAVGLIAIAIYAVLSWAPEILRRSFMIEPATSSRWLGAIIILCGTAGVIAGGAISDLAVRKRVDGRPIVLIVAAAIGIPAIMSFGLATTVEMALAGFAVGCFALAAVTSVGAAGVQDMTPAAFRGMGGATFQLSINLIGLGLGPILVAVLVDFVFKEPSRLGVALAIVAPVALEIAILLLFLSLRSYESAVDLARNWPDGSMTPTTPADVASIQLPLRD